MLRKSSSIRPRDKNLKPQYIKSENRKTSQRGASSPLIVVYGFLAIIILGACLLYLPFSHYEKISFVDALFTATSATTVTGLIVVDTASSWTMYGQVIIALLIILGGIGFMTGAAFFLIAAGQSLGLTRRVQIGQGLGEEKLDSVRGLVLKVVISSLFFQILGAVIFFILFNLNFDSNLKDNLWLSIFHSISSFNNAGFAIFQENSNLEIFSRGGLNNLILIFTSLLFFLGGIGYFVMNDLVHHRKIFGQRGFRRFRVLLSLETKMILIGSVLLTIIGTLLIFIFEFTNAQTIGQFTTFEKIINSLFTSMSTRTAGFNSFDMSLTHDYTNIICAIFMFIGGGPASTAGGIKITTFILSLLMIFSHLRGRENITFSGREIPYSLGVRSLIILVLSIFIVLFMIILILIFEDEYNFSLITFEVFSAFATNGMSTGSSAILNDYSKIVFILGMFIGRLGPMTLALLISGSKKQTEYRFFQEKVRIG
tara:strand:+ start:238 stop:1686 length:1449 start_codon:yes stop_codon:yes gene_type:complete